MTEEKRHIEAYLEAEKESRSHRAAFLKGYGDIMDFLNTAEEKDLPSLEELAALRTHQKSRVETLEKIALPLPKLAPIHDQLLAAERRILNGIVAFETGEKVNRKDRKSFNSHASLMQVAVGNAEPLFQEYEARLKALCTEFEVDYP